MMLLEKKWILKIMFYMTVYKIQTVGMVWPWMKTGSLEKFWNCVRLEEEERKNLEIRGCRRLKQE